MEMILFRCFFVFERSRALTADQYDRRRPGLNHQAFHVEDAATVEKPAVDAVQHGWRLMFPELHPYAGTRQHYAVFPENTDRFEVEFVAIDTPSRTGELDCSATPDRDHNEFALMCATA
ncbi:hypothetical protein [Streptomyces sp. NPDC059805]|uniref:hypothetical protein n=1 Tax=Streptomyces sp. NPDC059805 TaxID=3346954 RepID=UPI00365E94FA